MIYTFLFCLSPWTWLGVAGGLCGEWGVCYKSVIRWGPEKYREMKPNGFKSTLSKWILREVTRGSYASPMSFMQWNASNYIIILCLFAIVSEHQSWQTKCSLPKLPQSLDKQSCSPKIRRGKGCAGVVCWMKFLAVLFCTVQARVSGSATPTLMMLMSCLFERRGWSL